MAVFIDIPEAPAGRVPPAQDLAIDAQSTAFAFCFWLPRHPMTRVAPALVGPLARLLLRWLRQYRPAELAELLKEFAG